MSDLKELQKQQDICIKTCNKDFDKKIKEIHKLKKICDSDKELNPVTNRCIKKCANGYSRDENFKCIKNKTKKILKSPKKICPPEKEFNNITKRCVKKCKYGYRRNKDFKCVKYSDTTISEPKASLKIPNVTPLDDSILGDNIFYLIKDGSSPKKDEESISTLIFPETKSYTPEINKLLVSIKSMSRKKIDYCDKDKWLNNYNEPLKIMINNECVDYKNKKAVNLFLKNLSANKHINPSNVIAPKQSLNNCWFNTIFVAYFISDKGRKFFHFFRQCIIEGKTAAGDKIPRKLRNAFAVLNYAIESCIFGSEFAYEYDSNYIIKNIYNNLPSNFINKNKYIVTENVYGNGYIYFESLFKYIFLKDKNINIELLWVNRVKTNINDNSQPDKLEDIVKEHIKNREIPELFVIFYNVENKDNISNDKVIKDPNLVIYDKEYKLDSCILRDNSKNHFSAFITCEDNEYCFDGASYRRLSPFNWKDKINKNINFEFEKSDYNKNKNDIMKWNFTIGFQMLFYYRVK